MRTFIEFILLGWVPWLGFLVGRASGRRAERHAMRDLPMTDKQHAYILRLHDEAGTTPPSMKGWTVARASIEIDKLRRKTNG